MVVGGNSGIGGGMGWGRDAAGFIDIPRPDDGFEAILMYLI